MEIATTILSCGIIVVSLVLSIINLAKDWNHDPVTPEDRASIRNEIVGIKPFTRERADELIRLARAREKGNAQT